MKRALCMILFAAAFVGPAFAYTWTGGGADNRIVGKERNG